MNLYFGFGRPPAARAEIRAQLRVLVRLVKGIRSIFCD
jgi:hypothetical protein